MWKDCETELDFLDFDYLIDIVSEIVRNDSLLPSTIGVYGDWGSGKSSLINMSMGSFSGEKGTECIYFNGWLFEDYEDAKTALLGSILDTIREKRTLGEKAKKCIAGLYKSVDKMKLVKKAVHFGSSFFLTGGMDALAALALPTILGKGSIEASDTINENWVDIIKAELDNQDLREDITAFRDNFAVLLEETCIERLVVFIDELDRCSPDTILETLEAIRLFLYVGNTVFIIGADERHIAYAVESKFKEIEGIGINIGKEYLEKIVQYPVRIPRLSVSGVEQYIALLLMQKELEPEEFDKVVSWIQDEKKRDFLYFSLGYSTLQEYDRPIADKVKLCLDIAKQLSSVLARGLNGNPRHCKRFLNAMEMRLSMARFKGIELDRKILAKMMMLEYFQPRMFADLVGTETNIEGNVLELRQFEDGELNKLERLKPWKDDDWVKDWVKMDPQIGAEDLRPYFYFAQIVNERQYDTGTTKLSREAQSVLNNLVSGTQSGLSSALRSAGDVNDYEASIIIEHLFMKIYQSTEIKDMSWKSLLDWGSEKKETHANIIKGLGSIDGSRIKPPIVARVRDFGRRVNKIGEIDEVLDGWVKENPELFNFVKTEREG